MSFYLERDFAPYGSKRLTLYCSRTQTGKETYKASLITSKDPKIIADTTKLFTDLAAYLQNLADEEKREKVYEFSTANPKMIQWALLKAPWRWEEQNVNKKGTFIGKVIFRPKH